MASVSLVNATLYYPDAPAPAVDHVNLHINDGEFFALTGPVSSGKSTVLRMIAGLEDMDYGAVLLDGEDVTALPPSMRDVVIVFQNYALYPHMTVADNMGFHLKIAGADPDDIAARVAQAADILELTEFLDAKPAQLTRAERQRVSMGRAVVRRPRIFLMDEPLKNMDVEIRDEIREQISVLQERTGITTVYVTNDPREAFSCAHRVGIMVDGALQQVGTPAEILADLTTPVRAFLEEAGMVEAGALVDGALVDGALVAENPSPAPA